MPLEQWLTDQDPDPDRQHVAEAQPACAMLTGSLTVVTRDNVCNGRGGR